MHFFQSRQFQLTIMAYFTNMKSGYNIGKCRNSIYFPILLANGIIHLTQVLYNQILISLFYVL